ncbi:ankyrin repeat domain-containing protein [Paenibacillus sp. CF384]|uniref:ankyrin repeat domain-containing protein n=1 Tax=Paenibacillus sp. CF384 TaxID=1884382 RepID=UPI000899D48B|nr:ankyrin repeat domain-containing protein [Paenibacillus sp. CF384]SDY00761.1 Ankyrin repeat-containing protein [Paenibacillus sp. CF384]
MEKHIEDIFQAARLGEVSQLLAILTAHPELANTENEDGLTPLGFAAHFGNKDAVQALLDNGAAVNAISHSKVSYIPSNTALHAAIAGERNVHVISLLLSNQAQATILDSNGHTALHTAAFHDDNEEIIRLLLAHGADIHALTEDGKTASSIATEQGNHRVAALLQRASEAVS